MASSRRLARKKAIDPILALSQGERHISRHTLEHPSLGPVRMWSKGGKVFRVSWGSGDDKYFLTQHWGKTKLTDFLKRMGL